MVLASQVAKKKTGLDKDLKNIGRLESATRESGQKFVKVGLGLLFLIAVWIVASIQAGTIENSSFIIAAGIIGGYMALNIGANDVANNVGPAVGSKALTMMGALIIAAVFETAGAILAGGEVVGTIKKGIIDPGFMPDTRTFIWAMMAALLAAALWLNLATYLGAPVSTTHAIVGGVMGAGVAATGLDVVNWPTMGKIAASWVISPVMGGVIAALFLWFIKVAILYRDDKIAAARRWVPVLVAILAAAFSVYLVMKGLKKIWTPEVWMVAVIGATAFVGSYFAVRVMVVRASAGLENRRKAVAGLFVIPLIFSAALLSFAHGSNDVANAVGPLAAIVSASSTGDISAMVDIPLWVMMVGAVGISAGLALFGPKLVRTVGEKITKLNPIRAFCVALAASITVLIASALGLPVSSTHIAVGGVFGVGLFREFFFNKRRNWTRQKAAPPFAFGGKTGKAAGGLPSIEKEIKARRKSLKRKLVRRQHLTMIIAAWAVTVPAAAFLAAVLFFLFTGFFKG